MGNIITLTKHYKDGTTFVVEGKEYDLLLYVVEIKKLINDILFNLVVNENEPYWTIAVNGTEIYSQRVRE